jgi:4-hydroxymandelate oxidase
MGATPETQPAQLAELASVDDYGRRAREILPRAMWDALCGDYGAETWTAETNNVDGFAATMLRPRVLVDISARSRATTVLGNEISLPVMIAPSGSHQRWDAEGELATARAAGRAGTIMVLSSSSNYSIEEVAAVATGTLWFQIYGLSDRRVTERLVRRAEEEGYRAIVLTVDSPGDPSMERNYRFSRSAGETYDMTAEPKVVPTYEAGRSLRNFQNLGIEGVEPFSKEHYRSYVDPRLNWGYLAWLRDLTALPLVIKGIQTGEDSRLCAEHGVDGLVVSNHGGFALRNARATMEVLPEVVASAGSAEVYIDGGVRRGTDVLKAVGLGARAVLIGRAQAWGLTVGGEDGIVRVLDILRRELDDAMRFCGVTDIMNLDPNLVVPAPRAGVPDPVSRLERLAALHEHELLSCAEFERAKQLILNG